MGTSQPQRVVLASHNAHKLDELKRILTPLLPDLELVSFHGSEPEETGDTFAENSLIKARNAARETGLPAIADDSGLCVDALDGAPGIISARYAGRNATDEENLQLLLENLADTPEPQRTAHFVCAASLVTPAGVEIVREARWSGSIRTEPAGGGGFGYDPIFQPETPTRTDRVTAAELTREEKDAQSHRAQAFRLLAEDLKKEL